MMKCYFRPWYKEHEKENLLEYAKKMAKGNEIEKVEVLTNIYGEALLRVRYITATESQKKYGLYDIHVVGKLITKLPKKYQPENV